MNSFRERIGFWLLWTAFPVLGGIGWIQAAVQAQRWRYLAFGVLCLALSAPFVIDRSGDAIAYTAAPMLVAWVGCFVQALVKREEVNTRIRYSRIARRESQAWIEEQMAEYEHDQGEPAAVQAAPAPVPVPVRRETAPAQPSAPAPAQPLAPQPGEAEPAAPSSAPAQPLAPKPGGAEPAAQQSAPAQPLAPKPGGAEPAYRRPPPWRPTPPAQTEAESVGGQPATAEQGTEPWTPMAAEPKRRMPTEAPETKTCPDCGESVKAAARVCRYCGFRWRASGPAE